MRNPIKNALTKRIAVKDPRNQTQQTIEVPPNQTLLFAIYFAVAALITLTILETTYMLVLGSFNNEIFAAITLIIGTILGAFFSQKS